MTKQGIQEWRVPLTGNYIIKAAGAAGGGRSTYNRGRNIQLTTKLNKGEVISILVGQKGIYNNPRTENNPGGGGGGGGGTFIVRDRQNIILVAGGGGGIGNFDINGTINALSDAAPLNTGNGNNGCGSNTDLNSSAYYGSGGVSGNGGNGGAYAGGGAGLIGDGGNINPTYSSLKTMSLSFINGGIGGFDGNNNNLGGFGGGGASAVGGGGGGGYSGGGGCGLVPGGGWLSGGGGGSYGIGNPIDNGATNIGDGFVEIIKDF
jgi:hypothetical protein